jgi:hypothetical protein
MELRQYLQDDVVAVHARGEVEAEVRPEAVRVREQRALRPARGSRRVDEQERIVVLDVDGCRARIWRVVRSELEAERRHGRSRERLFRELGLLGLDEEHGGLGVGELVGELGRREAPVERQQREAGLGAREEHGDVLGAVPGQRRDPVAPFETGVEQRDRDPLRAGVELRVARGRAEVLDRDPVRSDAGAVGNPVVERVRRTPPAVVGSRRAEPGSADD